MIKAVKIVRFGQFVVLPDTFFFSWKRDFLARITGRVRAPYIVVVILWIFPTRFLKPGMPVRGMIYDQVDNHPDSPVPSFVHEGCKVPQVPERRVHREIVHDIISVVSIGGFEKGE